MSVPPLSRRALAPFAALGAALAACGAEVSTAPGPPSVVLIVADDLGWMDVGYNGSEIATPHLDRLAREGVRLERFYTAMICSPTRMGLLTGRYPIRWGMMNAVVRPWSTDGLPPEEVTIAEELARAGYVHRGLVGKWHLGHASRRFHPLRQGFTEFFGHYNGSIDYFSHECRGEPDWHRGFEPVSGPRTYSTDAITEEAVRFVEDHAAQAPFFLMVSYNAPHAPLQARPKDLARYADVTDPPRRVYAAMVTRMDDGIGRILAALDEVGAARDTLVWFLSDNGGDPRQGASNAPLRAGKSGIYEGGVRVPSAVRWPAGGIADGRSVASMVGYLDVLPTVLAAAGASPADRPLDGIDVLGVLAGSAVGAERVWFASTDRTIGRTAARMEETSVTDDAWKLVRSRRREVAGAEPSTPRVALYRYREDVAEARDVAQEHPAVVERLLAHLDRFRALADGAPQPGHEVEPPPGWKPPAAWRIVE